MASILFVDDEELVLNGLRRQLLQASQHWNCQFLTEADAALSSMSESAADVIVTDLSMPGTNGLQLAAAVTERYPGTPVIMLTGTADMGAAITALNEGNIFRFLTKPCETAVLVETIQEALDLAREVVRETSQLPFAALHSIGIGVAVCSSNGTVQFTNRAAARIFVAKDGLLVDAAGKLRAADSENSHRLMSAITRVAIEQISSPEGITIDRPSLNRPYNIIVLPLADMPGDALVFVTDPESQGVPDAVILRNLLGLSEAEARIAHSLAEGLKLDEAAERSGVTVSTARTYLKQIFQKTGVNRQSELIRYILTSPALMIDEARSLPGEDL